MRELLAKDLGRQARSSPFSNPMHWGAFVVIGANTSLTPSAPGESHSRHDRPDVERDHRSGPNDSSSYHIDHVLRSKEMQLLEEISREEEKLAILETEAAITTNDPLKTSPKA